MFEISQLPTVNAALNGVAALLLVTGYVSIKHKQVTWHRGFMVAALVSSALFLTSYLVYHARAGSHPFSGAGRARVVYFTVLLSHILLAAMIVPLVVMTLWRALKGRFDRHVAIARWTLPLWLYVSVTGVVVYLMLYVIY